MESCPASVVKCLEAYLGLLDRYAPQSVVGLYLFGSVSLGDYIEGRSDIDFVALSPKCADAAAHARWRFVHDALRQSEGPFLDGVYLAPHRLSQPPLQTSVAPCCRSGVFRGDGSGADINPVTWFSLVQTGIVVRGAEIASLEVALDPSALRSFLVTNLRTYWAEWLAQAELGLAAKPVGASANAAAISWGVLGVSRIAATLATGEIFSKTAAGRWARCNADTRWHPIIDQALDTRRLGIESMPIEQALTALGFIRHIVGRETTSRADRE